MPSHPDRARSAPLLEGYQFGDGHQHCWGDFPRDPVTGLFRCVCGKTKSLWQIFYSGPPISSDEFDIGGGVPSWTVVDTILVRVPKPWLAPHLNAADRLSRYQREYETGRDLGDEA